MYRFIIVAALCVASIPSHAQNPFSGAKSFDITLEKQQTGMASWYGYESGTETASGKPFDPQKMTCAMRRRDWGTILTVTVIATGKSAECELTDFGPAKRLNRLIDVSEGMARKLGFHRQGVVEVMVEEVQKNNPPEAHR